MTKSCQVVVLPTNQKAVIGENALVYVNSPLNPYWGYGKVIYAEGMNVECTEHHLYILSDDKIEVGDYVLDQDCSELFGPYEKTDFLIRDHKKVIASTDPTLNLPTIPEQSIQDWCKNPVENVLVEYHHYKLIDPPEGWKYGYPMAVEANEIIDDQFWKDSVYPDEVKASYGNTFRYRVIEQSPKPTLDNNQISIQVEKTYSREEVIAIINAVCQSYSDLDCHDPESFL